MGGRFLEGMIMHGCVLCRILIQEMAAGGLDTSSKVLVVGKVWVGMKEIAQGAFAEGGEG